MGVPDPRFGFRISISHGVNPADFCDALATRSRNRTPRTTPSLASKRWIIGNRVFGEFGYLPLVDVQERMRSH
jgi:hypothetical protein